MPATGKNTTIVITWDDWGGLYESDHVSDGSVHIRRLQQGELAVPDLYPGAYQLRQLGNSLVPYYLDSIRLGDGDALGLVSILSDGRPLTITYKLGGGTVRGTVEGADSGHVFLIPAASRCAARASRKQRSAIRMDDSSSGWFVRENTMG